jgi:hypothetical protein
VLPLTSRDFSGSVTDANGTTKYSASTLFAPLNFSQKNFLAVFYDQPQLAQASALAFGANTSLTVSPGWDNATGYGTPAGLSFIEAASRYPRQ